MKLILKPNLNKSIFSCVYTHNESLSTYDYTTSVTGVPNSLFTCPPVLHVWGWLSQHDSSPSKLHISKAQKTANERM